MTRIEVTRRVAADPASVALLLSGPAARDAWPSDGDVRVGPPMRSGVGFVADMTVVDAAERGVRGRYTITQAEGSPGASDVRLVLTSTGDDAAALRKVGEACVGRLAAWASARSSAA